MKPHIPIVVLLSVATLVGCQWNKSLARRSDAGAIATTPHSSQMTKTAGQDEVRDSNSLDNSAIEAASKRIDGSVSMALSERVPLDQYNSGSRNAANYPARTKVATSASNACTGSCSH